MILLLFIVCNSKPFGSIFEQFCLKMFFFMYRACSTKVYTCSFIGIVLIENNRIRNHVYYIEIMKFIYVIVYTYKHYVRCVMRTRIHVHWNAKTWQINKTWTTEERTSEWIRGIERQKEGRKHCVSVFINRSPGHTQNIVMLAHHTHTHTHTRYMSPKFRLENIHMNTKYTHMKNKWTATTRHTVIHNQMTNGYIEFGRTIDAGKTELTSHLLLSIKHTRTLYARTMRC